MLGTDGTLTFGGGKRLTAAAETPIPFGIPSRDGGEELTFKFSDIPDDSTNGNGLLVAVAGRSVALGTGSDATAALQVAYDTPTGWKTLTPGSEAPTATTPFSRIFVRRPAALLSSGKTYLVQVFAGAGSGIKQTTPPGATALQTAGGLNFTTDNLLNPGLLVSNGVTPVAIAPGVALKAVFPATLSLVNLDVVGHVVDLVTTTGFALVGRVFVPGLSTFILDGRGDWRSLVGDGLSFQLTNQVAEGGATNLVNVSGSVVQK